MMQGRAKKEKRLMADKIMCVGVDIANNTIDYSG